MPDPTDHDAETLAEVLRRADDEALTRTNFEQIVATYEEMARAILASDWLAARIEQARAETWTCPDCEGEFPAEQARAGEGALRERIEAVLAEPDDTQWWPVQPYMDPHDEDEVVEVQVIDVARVRAALADTAGDPT